MSATIHQANVHEDGSFTIVARLTFSDPAATPLTQADVDELEYWIKDQTTKAFVVGTQDGDGESILVADVITNTLQPWSGRPQSPGYNLLATFPPGSVPNGRRTYRLSLKITLANGQVGWEKWDLHAVETDPS